MREAIKKRRYRSFSEQRAAHASCQTVHHIRVKSRWNKLREERRGEGKLAQLTWYNFYDINFRPSFFLSFPLSLSCSLSSTGISSFAMTVPDVLLFYSILLYSPASKFPSPLRCALDSLSLSLSEVTLSPLWPFSLPTLSR